MKIEKVSFDKKFGMPAYGSDHPVVVEAILEGDETPEQAWSEMNRRMIAWHQKEYPALYEEKEPWIPGHEFPSHMKTQITFDRQPAPVIDYGKIERSEPDALSGILAASTLDELKTYKMVASTDKSLYSAYCNRIKELSV